MVFTEGVGFDPVMDAFASDIKTHVRLICFALPEDHILWRLLCDPERLLGRLLCGLVRRMMLQRPRRWRR